jgi:hypothetical protein
MKIKLSVSQWAKIVQAVGNKTMNKTAQTPSTAQQIETAFKGLSSGVAEASKAKVQEYAQRIMKGEKKEKVLEGQGPTMIKNVEAALAQLQGQKGQQAASPQSPSAPGVSGGATQPQGAQPDFSKATFSKLMADPNFKSTFDTIKSQRQNEQRILKYWKSLGINYTTMPDIMQIIG